MLPDKHPTTAETVVYEGRRDAGGYAIVTRTDHAGVRNLDPRLDLENHSPTGLNWGYGGSGPAQLALALACDATGDVDRALAVYKTLKWRLVSPLQQDKPWRMTQGDVLASIAELEAADPSLRERADRNRQRRADEAEIQRLEAAERAAGR